MAVVHPRHGYREADSPGAMTTTVHLNGYRIYWIEEEMVISSLPTTLAEFFLNWQALKFRLMKIGIETLKRVLCA